MHCNRASTGVTNWAALRTLTTALVHIAPTFGARVSLSALIAETDGAQAGLDFLNGQVDDSQHRFHPAWANTRVALLERLGRTTEARAAYARAIALTADPVLRADLTKHGESVHASRPSRPL